jgi:N-methylhydantoinase A
VKRIGIDSGGTFTDAVLWDEERGLISSTKVSSRRDDPASAIVAAAKRVIELAPEADRHDIVELVHGTTIGTNMSLEQNGPRIALITTAGFRDVLEIGRLTRPPGTLYDLCDPGSPPLVARRDRFEVTERLDHHGQILAPLDEDALQGIADVLEARGITSVAICFLYAYLDDRHERRAAEILQAAYPALSISLSSDVLPQPREFERTATTVLNAYLKPVCGPYLHQLHDQVRAWSPDMRTWIMQSNGGITSTARAAELPVNLLLSGPSGGVVAGQLIAQQTGMDNTITVDMGGTSFDVCLIAERQIPLTAGSRAMNLPVQVPTIDIATIGTGGGSIAHVDAGGQFLVGPASAGARPGPAAYGRGGTEPTVTDANVVLGILADGTPLGDDVVIDLAASLAACERLGSQLGLDAIETALGIRRIANAAMAGAVRAVSVSRGHDPREFVMNAFGGAGPMHAAEIARELSIPTVIVPPAAGVLSAMGLVVSDVVHNHAASFIATLDAEREAPLAKLFEQLAQRAEREIAQEGLQQDAHTLIYALDLHYAGQNTPITVPLDDIHAPGWSARACETFHTIHARTNGFRVDDEPVAIAMARITAIGQLTRSEVLPAELATATPPNARGTRELYWSANASEQVPRYDRDDLRPGDAFDGAAIIDTRDTTVVIPPGSTTQVDGFGNILIHLEARS